MHRLLASIAGRARIALPLIALLVSMNAPVQGAFTGDYDLNNFTLINTNADGSWSTPDNGATLLLTGGNNGSGNLGTTFFIMFAPEPVVVSFDYSISTLDDPLHPEYDIGGYLAAGKFFPLTLLSPSGSKSFSVGAGQGLGFAVETADNWGGAATLSITGFNVSQVSGVPEPAYTLAMPLLMAVAYLARRQGRLP